MSGARGGRTDWSVAAAANRQQRWRACSRAGRGLSWGSAVAICHGGASITECERDAVDARRATWRGEREWGITDLGASAF